LNRSISNKNTIQDAFLFLEQAQDLAKIAYNNLRNESKIYNDSKSNAIKKNTKDILKYTRKAAKKKDDNKLDEIENRETKKILE